MITLSNVCKTYNKNENKVPALQNISLTIHEGESVAITGASGSGKTTLLNILGCMDSMDSGEYTFHEVAVHSLSRSKTDLFRKNNIGFVFQQFALLNDYTVLENVELPLRARRMSKKKRHEEVLFWLTKVGLLTYTKRFPPKLSGGQQQRCAIARALVTGALLILADEPTGALDSGTSKEIIDLLLDLCKLGKTVVIVTHDEKVAMRADTVYHLSDGRVM